MQADLSPTVQTLFAELQQQVETAPPFGSVYSRARDGTHYYYAKVPVGSTRVDTFIGKVGDPDGEARAALYRRGNDLARDRRKLIAHLKREGLASPDRVLGNTIDAIAYAGLFRNGAVLVGTAAYMMSEALVGTRLPARTRMTGDVDLATADLKLAAAPAESLEAILKRGDPTFTPVLQLKANHPPSRFQTSQHFLVDIVTPVRRRGDSNPMPMKHLEAGAAPLQHMDWLIAEPVPTIALWSSGIAINVPQPTRFAVHKLILAQKRDQAGRVKRQKDLAQAEALIDALERHDPFALEDALADAGGRGIRGWRDPIVRSLKELGKLEIAETLEAR